MKIKNKFLFFLMTALTLLLAAILYPYMMDSILLNPKGLIALKQIDLIYIATPLMLIVVIPVLIMTFAICLRYRSSNKTAEYDPNWDHDTLAEAIWWGFPLLIVLILSVVTWVSTHTLDPFKPFRSGIKPVHIQVVALQWKWLFIYPEEKVASINFIQFPEHTPLTFDITADAPMNSFWIPSLGGQIYAMPGMSTKLHLISQEPGDFMGVSANLSGTGFAGMNFTARSGSQEDYQKWLQSARNSPTTLDIAEYLRLVKPSEYVPSQTYSLQDEDLYRQILMKYMMPDHPLREEKTEDSNLGER